MNKSKAMEKRWAEKRSIYLNQKFNRLLILELFSKNGESFAKCECDCPNKTIKIIRLIHILNGHTKSCGCFNLERANKKAYKHGDSNTRLYSEWEHIKNRCSDLTNKDYGGRGISICNEWENYIKFKEWALSNGYDDSLTIERKNVNGNYEPDNCEWIPNKDQPRNTRRTKYVVAFGERKKLLDWICDERCQVSYKNLLRRLLRGMLPEIALTRPKGCRNVKTEENVGRENV